MNGANLLNRNRATLKLLFVAMLSLAMLIPLVMVHAIIEERQQLQTSAERTISERWGGSQIIGGLVNLVKTPVSETSERTFQRHEQWQARVVAELDINAQMTTELRYLGIYEVPVYTTRVQLSGKLAADMLEKREGDDDIVFWLPLSDVRGVRKISPLSIGSLKVEARPLSITADVNSGLQFNVPSSDFSKLTENYSIELELSGSQSLQFLPLADSSHVTLESDWPDPEFIGQFLPVDRNIEDKGVQASWQMLGLNRPFGDQWSLAEMPMRFLNTAGFGIRLDTPVDRFQRNERSVKYGFLFIALTFFTLFMFEVMTGRPLHPVPYVLTGAAMAVFYLVLLALSEYLAFAASFFIAASLLILIVTPYTSAVLGARRRGYLVGFMMSLTYALLYVLVSLQHLSLLLGSMALLSAIASLMYMTRNVDWYNYGNND